MFNYTQENQSRLAARHKAQIAWYKYITDKLSLINL